ARGSVPSSHVTRRSRYAPVADCRSSTPTTVVVAWRVRSATGYATRTRRPIASSARWAISTISGAGLTSRRFTIDLLLGLPCLAAGLLILGPRLGTGAGALARGAPLRGPPLRLAAEEPAVLRGLRAMDIRAVRQVALRQRNDSGVAPRPGGQGARIECGADRGRHSVLLVRGWDLAGEPPRPRITGAADQPPRPSAFRRPLAASRLHLARPLLLVLPPQAVAGIVDRCEHVVLEVGGHAVPAAGRRGTGPVPPGDVPGRQIGRDAVAAGGLGRAPQVRGDTDRATHLVLHTTDSHPHRAVALPAPRGLALEALLLGLPCVRLRSPVVQPEAEDLDLG